MIALALLIFQAHLPQATHADISRLDPVPAQRQEGK